MTKGEGGRWWNWRAVVVAIAGLGAAGSAPAQERTAQAERLDVRDVLQRMDESQPRIVSQLGLNPVASPGTPLTPEQIVATGRLLAEGTPDWAEQHLDDLLRLVNGYSAQGTASDSQIVARVQELMVNAERMNTGGLQEVGVTELMREYGYTFPHGTRFYLQVVGIGEETRYDNFTQGAPNNGVALTDKNGSDSIAVQGDGEGTALVIRMRVVQTETTQTDTGINRIDRETTRDFFNACGNAGDPRGQGRETITAVLAPMSEERIPQCVRLPVVPPQGEAWTNENVQVQVIVIDLGRANTPHAAECIANDVNINVNCEGDDCARIIREAAENSQLFEQVANRVGQGAPRTVMYLSDAIYTPGENGGSGHVTLPVEAGQLHRNMLFAICFNEGGGRSTVLVVGNPDVDQNGVLTATVRIGENLQWNERGRRRN